MLLSGFKIFVDAWIKVGVASHPSVGTPEAETNAY